MSTGHEVINIQTVFKTVTDTTGPVCTFVFYALQLFSRPERNKGFKATVYIKAAF